MIQELCDNCGKHILEDYMETWASKKFCCNSCKRIYKEKVLGGCD